MTEQLIAEVDADKQATYADKIAKLLRKAETTDNEHEAEALTAKATALMETYAIDEEMLARARGEQRQEQITTVRIKYTGIFQSALMDIGWAVAVAHDCKGFMAKVTWEKPTHTDLALAGFESDLARIQLLDTSLQLQCTTAMRVWWNSQDRSWMSKMDAFKAKREFIMGFASGAGSKLRAARKAGQQEAAKHEAERTGKDMAAASTGVELVLRSRSEQVKDWYDTTYGRSTRKVTRRYSSGGAEARSAGVTAGRNANTGNPSVGSRKALGK